MSDRNYFDEESKKEYEERQRIEKEIEKEFEEYLKECRKKTLKTIVTMMILIGIPLAYLGAPIWTFIVAELVLLSPIIFGSPWSSIVTFLYYFAKPALYTWALVVTIQGVQDFFAIAFYVVFAIQAPKMIFNLIGAIVYIFKGSNS